MASPTRNPYHLPDAADAFHSVHRGIRAGRTVTVVNFHATPSYRRDEYRRQIEGYARHFSSVSASDLDDYFAGRWSKPLPGLIPVLYEGFRDAVDVMVPILEEFGFIGWLFVPSYFPNVPVAEQRVFAAANSLHAARTDEYPGERITLSWDEAREVAKRHVFACHSRTHFKIDPDTDPAILHDQIVVAKAELEEGIGQR